ncbi:hypothetical protein ANO11243_066820 [Dothideomycetidae sp. 11243]|nr:hypothetical protein ANO11243_066820 [fungal sp. No.11243]
MTKFLVSLLTCLLVESLASATFVVLVTTNGADAPGREGKTYTYKDALVLDRPLSEVEDVIRNACLHYEQQLDFPGRAHNQKYYVQCEAPNSHGAHVPAPQSDQSGRMVYTLKIVPPVTQKNAGATTKRPMEELYDLLESFAHGELPN